MMAQAGEEDVQDSCYQESYGCVWRYPISFETVQEGAVDFDNENTRVKWSLFSEALQCGRVLLWDETQNMGLLAEHDFTLVLTRLIPEKPDSKSLLPNSKNPYIIFVSE